jgi:hypothetical protein
MASEEFLRCVSNRTPPLEAQPASHIHFADSTFMKCSDGFLNCRRGADLGAVLDNALVLCCGPHQLLSFSEAVGAKRRYLTNFGRRAYMRLTS